MAPMVNGTSRRSVFRRRMTDRRLVVMEALKPQLVTLTVQELLDSVTAQSAVDWFDEFRVERIQLVLVDVEWTAQAQRCMIDCAPNLNSTIPTSGAEMLRLSQLSRYIVSKYTLKATELGDLKKPVFDVTGSQDQFRNDWLSCADDGLATNWYGMILNCDRPLNLYLDIVVDVSYRGFQ